MGIYHLPSKPLLMEGLKVLPEWNSGWTKVREAKLTTGRMQWVFAAGTFLQVQSPIPWGCSKWAPTAHALARGLPTHSPHKQWDKNEIQHALSLQAKRHFQAARGFPLALLLTWLSPLCSFSPASWHCSQGEYCCRLFNLQAAPMSSRSWVSPMYR